MRRPSRRRAFSATEVIVCTAVLALAMIPVVTLFSSGTHQTAFNEYFLMGQSLATAIGDRVVEKVLSRTFREASSFPLNQEVDLLETGYNIPKEELASALTESGVFSVHQVKLCLISRGLLRISVEVHWKQSGSPQVRKSIHHRLLCQPEAALTATYLQKPEPHP